MRADALIDDLLKIHPKGFDLSLERIKRLLDRLGNPHKNLPPVIHVAGTNGKGSTIAFCRAILEAAGYGVHVHTSPHLVNWHERFRLAADGGGKLVDDDTLCDAIERVAKSNANESITLFELLSAVTFVLFSEHKADFALVEVGLGGRFDATNVIANPLISVIAPVALDHQSYLGDTIEKIAFEKAGIIKPGIPVAIGPQESPALEVLTRVAEEQNAPVIAAFSDYDCYPAETGFVYQDGDGLIDLPRPALLGPHQMDNAGLAIAALRAADIALEDDAIAKGMQSVHWPGRMERLPTGKIDQLLGGRNAEAWIDGGHNPAAGEAVADVLETLYQANPVPTLMICGMINTKEPHGYFAAFEAFNLEVLAVPVSMSDATISASSLAEHAAGAGLSASSCENLQAAIGHAAHRIATTPETRLLFCGSLYLVGEVLALNNTPPA